VQALLARHTPARTRARQVAVKVADTAPPAPSFDVKAARLVWASALGLLNVDGEVDGGAWGGARGCHIGTVLLADVLAYSGVAAGVDFDEGVAHAERLWCVFLRFVWLRRWSFAVRVCSRK
jgi:hypothetical protein